MGKLIITNVGDPNAPKETQSGAMDAGINEVDSARGTRKLHWFQVEVSEVRRGRKVTASRNFTLENRDTLDREWAVEAMASGENLAEGEDAWQMQTVDLVPRPVVINNEVVRDDNGVPRLQTRANIIVLPGETLRAALTATNKEFRLREDGPFEHAEAAAEEEELVSGVA